MRSTAKCSGTKALLCQIATSARLELAVLASVQRLVFCIRTPAMITVPVPIPCSLSVQLVECTKSRHSV